MWRFSIRYQSYVQVWVGWCLHLLVTSGGGGGRLQAGSWDGVAPDLALPTPDLIPRSPPVGSRHSWRHDDEAARREFTFLLDLTSQSTSRVIHSTTFRMIVYQKAFFFSIRLWPRHKTTSQLRAVPEGCCQISDFRVWGVVLIYR